MKTLKNVLALLLVLMISVITFYTFNLIFSIVSNYQSLSLVSLSSIPMIMFMSEIFIVLFAIFNYIVLERRDAYFQRKYSLIIGSFALIGVIFSILDGTIIYHTFVGDYVFSAYPLFMLIIHLIVLGAAGYFAFISIRTIVKEKPAKEWQNPKLYWLRELFIGEMLVFALERLGAFVLIPMFWSSYDSAYVIPFYGQLLIPTLVFVTYMVHEHWLHNRKVTIILSSIAFGYTVFSLTYMLILSHNRYPLTVNPLSPIMQLERLTTTPVGAILLYGFCLLVPGLNLANNIIMKIKEHKAKNAQ